MTRPQLRCRPDRIRCGAARWLRSRAWLAALVLAPACGGEPEEAEPLQAVGVTSAAISVEEAVSAGCSTAQLEALSLQIIAQGNCITPDAFAELPSTPNVTLGGAVLPYIQAPARDALVTALEANPSTPMQINSMLRTVAQQYLLYRWYQQGICGIGLAATPGNSNHETGLAIDIQQYGSWQSILEASGFSWLGASDPVHFDYVGAGAVNHQGLDVLAFQQLWNRNHPEDLIGEDGIYGPQTESRLMQSPADGFPLGADCGEGGSGGGPSIPPPMGDVEIAAQLVDAADTLSDGPSAGVDDLFAGERYTLQIDLHNTGSGAAEVQLDMALPEGLLLAEGFSLASDAGGAFAPIAVPPGNPPTDATLPAEVSLVLGEVEAGGTVRVEWTVLAQGYSVASSEVASVQLAVGDDVLPLPFDVYDQRRYEFDGGRLEGWEPAASGVIVSAMSGERLELSAQQGAPAVQRLGLSLPVGELGQIRLRGSRSGGQGPATLYVATDGADPLSEGAAVELSWPADGEVHTISLNEGALGLSGELVTAVVLVAFEEGGDSAGAQLDYVHLGAVGELRIPGTNQGCSCTAAGGERGSLSMLWLASLLGLWVVRRRSTGSRSA